MDKRRTYTRGVELAKDVLILVLTCTALWLAGRSQLFGPLGGIFREEDRRPEAVHTQGDTGAEAVRPLAITANLTGGGGTVHHGLRYNAQATDLLFQQTAGLLMEALSSAEPPTEVARKAWESALETVPGLTFDFQGIMPLEVLAGWLGGDCPLEAQVRRLTLTLWEGTVALCYRDEESGHYYRALSQVASPAQLTQALDGLAGNGAIYAFESEEFRALDPDTLLLTQLPTPAVYLASNPVAGGQNALEELMEDLDLPVSTANFYSSGDEEVARTGDEMVRLSTRGVFTYLSEEGSHFPVQTTRSGSHLFEAVEACRQRAAAAMHPRSGGARLYLLSARETDEGLEVRFGFHLNGILVRQEGGCAARFLVRDGRIVQFTLNLRQYTPSDESTPVLPLPQAAAALGAMGLEGEELLLAYSDGGGERVVAAWTAADSHLFQEG